MLNENAGRFVRACNVVCAALMLALLVLQFLPFWSYETEEGARSASIQSYIWFPGDMTDLEASLAEATGDEAFSVNAILGMPIVVLLAGAAGVVLCLIKSGSPLASLLPLACGAAGVYGFLAKPAFRLGESWGVQLALSAAVLLLALAALVRAIAAMRRAQGN